MQNSLLEFIETAIQDLETGQANAEQLTHQCERLSQDLEEVENQYAFGPEEEDELRLALLHSVRLYQHSLDLLKRCLLNPDAELLERARSTAEEASFQLDEIEAASESP